MRPGACSANSKGYADVEHSLNKPRDVLRIVVIGDSIAAGQGVAREERFSSRMAQALGDRRVEIVVLARIGYSTAQELVILDSEAFSYEPDLIIWVYCLNDPANPIYHDANGELGRYYHRPRSQALHQVRKLLFLARENWARADCGEEYHTVLHCVYRDAVEANIRTIGSLARFHQTTVLFAIVPVLDRVEVLEPIHQQVAVLAEQAGLVTVDLLRLFRDVAPGTYALPAPAGSDPWHPNAAGHALIAGQLTEEVEKVLAAP
jgi:lysophospholipase L1-like esterase